MNFAPIALFTFNRPQHTLRTIEALKKNTLASKTDIIVFSDFYKKDSDREAVLETRGLLKKIDGFNSIKIIERTENFGLAKNIINGVSEILNAYQTVIVLEDDIETSPQFLEYMNNALNFYKPTKNILSITGWSPETLQFPMDYSDSIYFLKRPMSWSWATWRDRWTVDWSVTDYEVFKSDKQQIKTFNQAGNDLARMLELQMDGKIDSWYVRWCYHSYKNNLMTIYPRYSFVKNIGHDGTGIHCKSDKNHKYSHKEIKNEQKIVFTEPRLNQSLVKNFNKFFNLNWKYRLKLYIKSTLKI